MADRTWVPLAGLLTQPYDASMSELGDALDAAKVTPAELQDALGAVGSDKGCPGRLIGHADGQTTCTEEAEGRRCHGYEQEHRTGPMSCGVAFPEVCPVCGAGGD